MYCLFKNTFYYVGDVLQYQMAYFFLNSEDTGTESTKILRHKRYNEHHSWSKWTSKKYVIGALSTDTAQIPCDVTLYRELQIIII